VDVMREEVHRDLIEVYLAANQPATALRQYRQCEDILQRELAVAPMRETQALLSRILAANPQPTRPVSGGVQRDDRRSSLLAELARDLAASATLVQEAVAACNQVQARLSELTQHPTLLESRF